MKFLVSAVLATLLLASALSAFPPRQHLVRGSVASVDRDKIVLAVTDAAEGTPPVEFTVREGRSRFRENGRNASVSRLRVGQEVRVYYRTEAGLRIVVEVSWKTASTTSSWYFDQ